MIRAFGILLATVVWRGDFETGDLSQWSKAQQVSPDRLQVVTSPVREGAYALKATVRQGDDPIGASGNRNELVYFGNEAAGSEYFYKWSTMFASDYPSASTWQLFAQWHHFGCCGSPPVQLIVNGERLILAGVGQEVWSAPLQRGKWYDFVFHVKWSADPRVGFMELWVDGELALPKTSVATMFAGDSNYLKLGLYRNDTIAPVGVVFHDGFLQASTLEDVIPPKPPPPPPAPPPPVNEPLPAAPPEPTPVPANEEAVSPFELESSPDEKPLPADSGGGCAAGRAGVTGLLALLGVLRRRRRTPSPIG
ncbi:MAG: polysaccharide lyase, partial [Myxococcota bacterium]